MCGVHRYGTGKPATAGGKLFICGYLIISVPLFALLTQVIAKALQRTASKLVMYIWVPGARPPCVGFGTAPHAFACALVVALRCRAMLSM